MSATLNHPEPTLNSGDKFSGFKVLRVETIPALRITAYEIEHEKTGARILHLHSFDHENLYAICFRTPPADSTGLPHILEHSVLAGSKKYPLKDVFKELFSSSMQTFINAFTYPDKTIYPVASQIKKDFYNLARVYTDLVFNPRMLKETFLQEGHHLEFSTPGDLSSDLIISGIVYNEMKGAYSSPDALMYKTIQENIYPNTIYSFDSGGDPEIIPKLTYEQFKNFHQRYYSPSNARFFLYGDIPTSEHLSFLSEMLEGSGKTDVNSEIASQQPFPQPRYVNHYYPVGKDESLEKKTMVNLAWMLAENKDYETALLLEIVSALLLSSAASPLRKALIDSGLGEDLTPVSGMESDLKQIMFCVGLRNIKSNDAEKIEKLILDTLAKIVKEGYDKELIEGVLHQIEFHGREIVRGSYPYGISLMGSVFQTWLYEGDPLISLNFPQWIKKIRGLLSQDPRIFEIITKEWFIDNSHRLMSVMEPDSDFNAREEKKFKEKMAEIKNKYSSEQLQEIDKQAAQLKKYQTEEDSAEAVRSLPKLQIDDIPKSVEIIPAKSASISEVNILEHDIFTNGIAYIDLAFDLSNIPEEYQSYLPLLGKIMLGMGAAGFSYEEMAKLTSLNIGGLTYDLAAGFSADGKSHWQKMIFSFKSLYQNIPKAADIVNDILTENNLEHKARMQDLIAERKNSLHSSIIPSAHIFAKRAAGAALTLPGWRDEQWHGRTQFKIIQNIAQNFSKSYEELSEIFAKLKKIIFTKDNLFINITADETGLNLCRYNILRILNNIPNKSVRSRQVPPALPYVRVGIAIPSQVSYVARVVNTPPYADPSTPFLALVSRDLSNTYLYKKIRVQGGAYGGMSAFDSTLGLFAFLSYRDPHIVETLKIFDEAQQYYSQHFFNKEELEKAIISTVGAMDKPMDPAKRGYASMMRHFAGVSDDMRQNFRYSVLSATPQNIKKYVGNYFASADKSEAVAVYSAMEKLNEANNILNNKLVIENLIE
ncbi:MAG: insulinase family protein [Syntrophaceae bacterium]|nr:insulinase family protein [Syntrophaceae bacterium]